MILLCVRIAKCWIEYFSEVLLLSAKCKLTIASFTTVLLSMNEVSNLTKTGQNVVLPCSNHIVSVALL